MGRWVKPLMCVCLCVHHVSSRLSYHDLNWKYQTFLFHIKFVSFLLSWSERVDTHNINSWWLLFLIHINKNWHVTTRHSLQYIFDLLYWETNAGKGINDFSGNGQNQTPGVWRDVHSKYKLYHKLMFICYSFSCYFSHRHNSAIVIGRIMDSAVLAWHILTH